MSIKVRQWEQRIGISLFGEARARLVERQQRPMCGKPYHDQASDEDHLYPRREIGNQLSTARKRMGHKNKQERIDRRVILGILEITELHGQAKHDQVHDGKPYKRVSSRIGTEDRKSTRLNSSHI